MYTIHNYILTNTSNTFQINQQQHAFRAEKYGNAHAHAVTIDFSTLRTF